MLIVLLVLLQGLRQSFGGYSPAVEVVEHPHSEHVGLYRGYRHHIVLTAVILVIDIIASSQLRHQHAKVFFRYFRFGLWPERVGVRNLLQAVFTVEIVSFEFVLCEL